MGEPFGVGCVQEAAGPSASGLSANFRSNGGLCLWKRAEVCFQHTAVKNFPLLWQWLAIVFKGKIKPTSLAHWRLLHCIYVK